MNKHVIFFDSECALCHRAVRLIFQADRKGQFLFAPINGETYQKKIAKLESINLDTMILLENVDTKSERVWIEGKAVLKTCYHLGGIYSFLGLFSFLPSGLFDLFYREVAKRRYKIFKTKRPINPDEFNERLLP